MWVGNDMPDDLTGAGGANPVISGDVDSTPTWPADGVGLGGGAVEAVDHEPLPFDTITAVDMDGDGVLETMIVHDGEQITVSYDLDGDGYTDYETVFDEQGRASSWQDQRDADGSWHWRRVGD